MVDDLSPAVPDPARFLNAHWLNPAYLVPLIEISPGQHTDEAVTARLMALLEWSARCRCAARHRRASSSRASRRWR